MFNSKQMIQVIVVLFFTIGISGLLISGCTISSSKPTVSVAPSPRDSPILKKSDAEGIPRPPEPEPVPVLIHQEESDPNPFPTPVPNPPNTPIHPFWELEGNPPAAPGLAMRHRVFDAEPPKIAYITIDDGPYPETTPKILKILKEEGIKATFFVVGRQIETYPQLLKDEYEQGHAIGNHTYSHDYSIIYRSPEDFLADVKKNDDLINKLIGIHTHILRAPGGTQGHFNVKYFNAVDAADYMVYDWNSSLGDTAGSSVPADQLVRNIEVQVPGKDRVILLMHDICTKITSVEALPRIIHYLKKEGYAFGVLTPKVAPIIFAGGFKS
ncbi:MAG: polysaccharide deacetylase family protein [Desulfitobacteriaceae bacterium]